MTNPKMSSDVVNNSPPKWTNRTGNPACSRYPPVTKTFEFIAAVKMARKSRPIQLIHKLHLRTELFSESTVGLAVGLVLTRIQGRQFEIREAREPANRSSSVSTRLYRNVSKIPGRPNARRFSKNAVIVRLSGSRTGVMMRILSWIK
jgi:hypothetical protein